MFVRFTKLDPKATVPTRGSQDAAGYDLYACANKANYIQPNATATISTGLAMEIPVGYFGAIYARSGLATKRGLRPANCVGVIDSDYRGEVKVALHNDSEDVQTVMPGDRVAQIIVQPCKDIEFAEVDNLTSTKRGDGGFGSTGSR